MLPHYQLAKEDLATEMSLSPQRKKAGLKKQVVARTSQYSGIRPKAVCSLFTLKVLKGTHLLASDIQTEPPTSDPMCWIWCGYAEQLPSIFDAPPAGQEGNPFYTTKVVYATINPRWDEEVAMPLDSILSGVNAAAAAVEAAVTETDFEAAAQHLLDVEEQDPLTRLLKLKCFIYLRDEDINEDGIITYEELGMIELSMADIIAHARPLSNGLANNAQPYPVSKMPGMPNLGVNANLGTLTLGATLTFEKDALGAQIKTALGADGGNFKGKQLIERLQRAAKGEPMDLPARPSTGDSLRSSRDRGRSSSPVHRRLSTAGALGQPSSSASKGRSLSGEGGTDRGRPRYVVEDKADDAEEEKEEEEEYEEEQDIVAGGEEKMDDTDGAEAGTETEMMALICSSSPKISSALDVDPDVNLDDKFNQADGDEALPEQEIKGESTTLAEKESGSGEGQELNEVVSRKEKDNGDAGDKKNEKSQDQDKYKMSPIDEPEVTTTTGASAIVNVTAGGAPELTEFLDVALPALPALPEPDLSRLTEGPKENKGVGNPNPTPKSNADVPESAPAYNDTDVEQGVAPSSLLLPKPSLDPIQITDPAAMAVPVGGGGLAAAMALRDRDREVLSKSIEDLTRITEKGLRELGSRLSAVEHSVEKDTTAGGNKQAKAKGGKTASTPSSSVSSLPTAKGKRDKDGALQFSKETSRASSQASSEAFKKFRQSRSDASVRDPSETGAPPSMELIHKTADGTVCSAPLGDENNMSPQRRSTELYGRLSVGGIAGGAGSCSGVSGNSGNNTTGLALPPRAPLNAIFPLATPLPATPDWGRVTIWLRGGDLVSAYCEVLDRGTPADFGRLLAEGGLTPSALSTSVLNRACDQVALLMMQGSGQYTEIGLLFVLAILRDGRVSGAGTGSTLLPRTKEGLVEALGMIADLPSKQGLLAGLLQTQLSR